MIPNTVFQGDCIGILKKIPAGSVDLVFADPPFNIGYEYDIYDDRRSREEYLDWSKAWMSLVSDVLKPAGTFWLAIGDEFAAELKLIAQNEIGFTCRSWVIWYYTFGVNCVRGFSRSHTHLFHFIKDPDHFTFNSGNPAVRVLSARQLVYADNRANPKGRLPDNTWILRPQDAPRSGFAATHDTWYFARVAGTFKEREGFHGCQMPEQLLGRIIRICSQPGELVLDPFAGSGTTLAVAKKLGRQWLGIELSKDYATRIQKRMAGTEVGDPLDGPENPVRSAPSTGRGKRKVRLIKGRPIPETNQDMQQGIIDAYRTMSRGNSTDAILCDPQLLAEFDQECKKRKLPGDAYVWNRLLLRIRKSGKLPGIERSGQRFTFEKMDSYSDASEIAMHLVSLDYGLTLDDMLCSPQAASTFDRIAEQFAPGYSSFEYRWAALSIRKRAIKSKSLAWNRFADWAKKRLPRNMPLGKCLSEKFERPGVYLLASSNQTLYVGETCNLRTRIARILENETWTQMAPRSVKWIPSDEYASQHGLQSMLIGRMKPLLNSELLRPKCDLDQP
ncbi:MAG: site-specific DNA-methyltransferase [Pirellulales bacterium]|nr:site-specific DNA-methyltransferase [Pirellulales bacterium]